MYLLGRVSKADPEILLTVAEALDALGIGTSTLRAWLNFDGDGGATVRESFNVDGVTRNSTGDYTVTWEESISSTASIIITAGDTGTAGVYAANIVAITESDVNFQIRDASGTLVDADTICLHAMASPNEFLLLEGDMQTGTDILLLEGDESGNLVL